MPVVFETIENGRILDISDFKGEYIYGGHVIIKKMVKLYINLCRSKRMVRGMPKYSIPYGLGTYSRRKPYFYAQAVSGNKTES